MINSILKWPGGKSRVMPDLLQHLPAGECLTEPFVGGAAVFLNTNYRRYVLGDINPDLINLYRCVTGYVDLVIDAARTLFRDNNNAEDYYKIRALFNNENRRRVYQNVIGPDPVDIARAARFLYLNRHGYNGMVRYNRSGGYNVPAGRHDDPPYFPETQARLFAEKANDTKTIFVCCSFESTLKIMTGHDEVIYCDPPYLPVKPAANFTKYHVDPFGEKEHRTLAATLTDLHAKTGVQVVISNSDTAATREIYRGFNFHEISVHRSVNAKSKSRGAAREVIGTLGNVENRLTDTGGHCADYQHCLSAGAVLPADCADCIPFGSEVVG